MIFSLILSLLIACIVMWIAWVFFLWTRNPGVVDVFWGVACFAVAFTLLSFAPTWGWRQWISVGLVGLWALRLCGYLALTRVFKGHHDPRYKTLSQDWRSQRLGFFFNYSFQALLAWLIAMPPFLMLMLGRADMGSWQWLGVFLFVVGLVGETIADLQLRRFKRSTRGPVCQTGLWRYSRHPNYFFEWVVWMSFALLATSTIESLFGFIGPLILFIVMFFMTGPITERQSLSKHGAVFKRYQQQTSYFFLWFRRESI